MEKLIKNKAVWVAFFSFWGLIVMRYTQVPEEIWQSFIVLAGAIVAVFIGEEIEKGLVRSVERTLRELDTFRK